MHILMAKTTRLKANCWTHGTGLTVGHVAQHQPVSTVTCCDRKRIDQSGGYQQAAAAFFSSSHFYVPLSPVLEVKIKTFPFIAFYFYLKLLFFTIFMKVFI
jgi:hypothetical protein